MEQQGLPMSLVILFLGVLLGAMAIIGVVLSQVLSANVG